MSARERIGELLGDLRELWSTRRGEVDAQWRRTLPLADYVVDRWEKARALGWGEGTSVYDSALIIGDVRVGAHTWIGPSTVLDGSGGGLVIGDHCTLSAGVQVYTHDTVERTLSAGASPTTTAPTRLGDRVYVGPQTVIAKGVTIGDGCVIGAHSLVLHDVPTGSKAFGVPCRVVGSAPSPDAGP